MHIGGRGCLCVHKHAALLRVAGSEHPPDRPGGYRDQSSAFAASCEPRGGSGDPLGGCLVTVLAGSDRQHNHLGVRLGSAQMFGLA